MERVDVARAAKDAVEQITRRCDTLGTALAVSGNEMIVWKTA